MTVSNHNKKIGFVRLIAGNLAIFALLLIAIEGLASYGLLIWDIKRTTALPEQQHTKYDTDLGWVNKPNVYLPDIYGPGVYLRTNAQGFRNDHDIIAAVPEGKIRVICSGDSFTLGYGVDNRHTWCELLSVLEPWLETVNMGQGGYGVDQAYLWYKRDAAKIAHQVQLLAFITPDFYRIRSGSFWGYGKPVLKVENGALVVKNVPVPPRSYYSPWISRNSENVRRLRTVGFLERGLQKLGARANFFAPIRSGGDEEVQEVLRKIFEDLQHLNEQRSSKLVLVYLPMSSDLRGQGPQQWLAFLEQTASSLGIPLINLFSDFRSLPYHEMIRLFIPPGQLIYPGAAGHLNEAGNEFVARAIHDKLIGLL